MLSRDGRRAPEKANLLLGEMTIEVVGNRRHDGPRGQVESVDCSIHARRRASVASGEPGQEPVAVAFRDLPELGVVDGIAHLAWVGVEVDELLAIHALVL